MDDNCVLDFSPVQLYEEIFHMNSQLFMLQLKYIIANTGDEVIFLHYFDLTFR